MDNLLRHPNLSPFHSQAWCNDTFAFNEISQAWDFQDTSTTSGTFNTRMWYNATGRYGVYQTPPTLVRVNQVRGLEISF